MARGNGPCRIARRERLLGSCAAWSFLIDAHRVKIHFPTHLRLRFAAADLTRRLICSSSCAASNANAAQRTRTWCHVDRMSSGLPRRVLAARRCRGVGRHAVQAGQLVCRTHQTCLDAAELGLRTGLDRALCDDRGGRLAVWRNGERACTGCLGQSGSSSTRRGHGFLRPQAVGLALVDIVALWCAIFAFILAAAHKTGASLLFVPYLLWVSYATALNVAIWWSTPDAVR